MCLQVHEETVENPDMTKRQSEAEMNAELRRIANEMRQTKEELRSYISGESELRGGPTLPTELERKLRRIVEDRQKHPRK